MFRYITLPLSRWCIPAVSPCITSLPTTESKLSWGTVEAEGQTTTDERQEDVKKATHPKQQDSRSEGEAFPKY